MTDPQAPDPTQRSDDAQTFLRRVTRSGLWNVLGFIGASGNAFIIAILVGRTTGPVGLGRFSYYSWLLRIFSTLLIGGLPAALARFIPESLGSSDTSLAAGAWRLVSRIGLIISVVSFIAMATIALLRHDDLLFAVVVGVGAVIGLSLNLMEAFLQGVRRFKDIARIVTIAGFFQVGAIVIAVWLKAGVNTLFMIFVLTNLPAALLLFRVIARSRSDWKTPALSRAFNSKVMKFAGMLTLVALIDEVVYGRPEIFFLDRFNGIAEVGYYNVGLKFASLVVILPAVVSKSLLPEFSFVHGAEDTAKFREVFPILCRLVAYIAAGSAIIGAMFSGLLVTVVYGAAFKPAILPTAVLLGGSLFGGVAGPVAAALFAGSKERFFVQAGLLLVVLNIGLDLYLIPRYGLNGAAAATIASQTVGIGIGFYLSIKKAGLPYPMKDLIKLVAAALVAGAAGRALASFMSGMPALVIGGMVALLTYMFLADRLRVVTLRQLMDLVRRSPLSTESS
ncbi:MAG: flippase [Actinomycetota bacterium]|nr:flippase [Actinomycetota bacterium]